MTKPASKKSLIERTRDEAKARASARLAELLALIRRRMGTVVESFYDIGEALREIVEKKLYAVADHKSFNALLTAERLMSARQAAKLLAVVRNVPRTEALGMGLERTYALVAYTAATPEDDRASELIAQNAEVGGKAVTKSSRREIEAATKEVRERVGTARAPTAASRAKAKADAAGEKALRAALRAAGLGRATITMGRDNVRVVLTRAQVDKLVG